MTNETKVGTSLPQDVDPTIRFILEAFALRVECVTVVHSTEPLEIRTTILIGTGASTSDPEAAS